MVRYFQEALGTEGVVHTANSEYTLAMERSDKSVLTPPIHDQSYIDFLINYCCDNKITAILSVFDIDLPILARNREYFEQLGITLVVSSYEVIQTCEDKWQALKSLRSIGLSTPRSYLSLGECEDALTANKVKFPLITKPRWGTGSIGIHRAEDSLGLKVIYGMTKRDICRSYLKYESSNDLEHNVILQEELIGDEYGLDVFNDLHGSFLTCIPKKKLAMRAGETDRAEIIEDSELFELGRKISRHLNHVGNLDVDCIKSGDTYCFLDLNPRFGGQYPFCHLAGADFPKAIVKMLRQEPVEAALLEAKPGTIGTKDVVPCVLEKGRHTEPLVTATS
jgi:carbamoyl-phosphate synthase large subunit